MCHPFTIMAIPTLMSSSHHNNIGLIKIIPVTECRYLSRQRGICSRAYSYFQTKANTNVHNSEYDPFRPMYFHFHLNPCIWFPFHYNLFPNGPITNIPALGRQWLGIEQATNLYSNQWWPSCVTNIHVIGPRCVKTIVWIYGCVTQNMVIVLLCLCYY